MSIDAELLRSIAAAYLRRDNLDDQLLAETAARLQGLLDRLRALDADGLAPLPPAFTFVAAAPAYRRAPAAGPAPWAALAGMRGGTGYGGTQATVGAAAPSPVTPPPPPAPGSREGDFAYRSLAELAELVRRREASPVEITRALLDRIERVDPTLNAFVTVTADAALEAARRAEAEVARGSALGPLHGVPVALKDLFETAGLRTTGGSRVLADYVPAADATCVTRLREAGAILVGKTATHEFAFGPTTDSPFHGPTRNPWNTDHSPAGSSGGSGAAVAAGLVPFAMGTDTGGSIRMPAAVCGVVGLKPSFGRVSKAGVLPLSWSLDHPGPLCRSVLDAALVLGAIAGPDPLDPTAAHAPVDDYAAAARAGARGDLRGVRLGVPEAWLADGRVEPDVLAAFRAACDALRLLGAAVEPVELPPVDAMVLVNRVISLSEGGAYHAPTLKARGAEYGADVRARFELGQFLLAQDYLAAQRLRGEMARAVNRVMQRYDALLTPALPVAAPRIGQRLTAWGEPVAEAMIRFTAPFSVTGQPGLSVPCGFTAAGLPVGLQIVGRPFDEATTLRIGAAFEAATDWHARRPLP